MKRLDFTPSWYYDAVERRLQRRRRLAWVLSLSLAMAMWSSLEHVRTSRARAEVARWKSVFEAQHEAVTNAAIAQQAMAALEAKQTLYSELAGDAPLHRICAELAEILPPSVVLEDLSIDRGDRLRVPVEPDPLAATSIANPAGQPGTSRQPEIEPNTVLSGYAFRDTDVGRLVNGLSESAIFLDVHLKYTRPSYIRDREVRAFEIECRLPQFE
jgi:hypothetical protein